MKRLSGWDAMLLYSETPNVHMHTIKVGVIDIEGVQGTLDVDAFRRTLRRRLYKLYPLRYQLVDIPLKLHHPMWREHCEVDLDYHVQSLPLPSPGGRRELDAAVGQVASTPLDRSKPLWIMYFVEGIAGGHVGVISKIHHALADGVASANLLALAMDVTDVPAGDRDSYETDPAPRTPDLIGAAFRDHLRQIGRLPGVLRYTAEGIERVRRSSRKLSPSLTRPFVPPPTFINHVLTPERRFATATLALADVKETRKQLGVTINDLVLAMSAGALRELLLKYDGSADHPLLASVPVSLDPDPNRISGNRFTGILVPLPTHVCYPLERVEQVHLAAQSAKESHHLLGPELVARWSSYIPPAAAEAMFQRAASNDRPSKLLNLTVSNVAGPRERGKVAGAVVREIYSVGPVTGRSGMNITVWSYVDQLNISVLTDGATVDDPHEVTDAMVRDFVEIRSAAGLSETLTQLDTALPQVVATP